MQGIEHSWNNQKKKKKSKKETSIIQKITAWVTAGMLFGPSRDTFKVLELLQKLSYEIEVVLGDTFESSREEYLQPGFVEVL